MAFFARPLLRQMPIHTRFGTFIGQVLAPATQIGRSGPAFGVHAAIFVHPELGPHRR